ncbi:hypothetical protein GOODEAATRI_009689, partial [Goodea atripinnis]
LLDASAVSVGLGLDLTLVLEYIDQDLSTFLSKAPACGLSRDLAKLKGRADRVDVRLRSSLRGVPGFAHLFIPSPLQTQSHPPAATVTTFGATRCSEGSVGRDCNKAPGAHSV